MRQMIWERWKRFGRFIGNVLARVVLTIFYVTVFVPFGLGVRLFSDQLEVKRRPSSLWRSRAEIESTVESARRQS